MVCKKVVWRFGQNLGMAGDSCVDSIQAKRDEVGHRTVEIMDTTVMGA